MPPKLRDERKSLRLTGGVARNLSVAPAKTLPAQEAVAGPSQAKIFPVQYYKCNSYGQWTGLEGSCLVIS